MKVVFLEEEVECLLKAGLLNFAIIRCGGGIGSIVVVRCGSVVGIIVEDGCRGVIEKSLDVGFKLLAVVAGFIGLVVARASGRPGVLHDADSALCSRCGPKYKKIEGRKVYEEVEEDRGKESL